MSKSYFEVFPVLNTEKLVLKEIKFGYVDDIYNIYKEEEVARHYAIEKFKKIEDAENLVKLYNSNYEKKRLIRWGIAFKDTPVIIGSCGFYDISSKKAKLAYDLNLNYQKKGVMTEALKRIIKFGFEEMGLNRIEVLVMEKNIASFKFLEKIGFVKEGILREYEYFKGQYHDLSVFSLLKKDFDK